MLNSRISILMLFILIGALQPANALERTRLGLVKEDELSLLTGLEYEEADYGTPDTTSLWRVPISLSYRHTNFGFSASMPLLSASSDGNINVSNKTAMKSESTSFSKGQNSEFGIGDITLSGSLYITPDVRDEISYRLTGIVKFGTADETKGLGTGQDDFFIEGGVVKYLDEYTLSGTLGYEFSGDSPDFEYNNVLYGTAGLAKQLAMQRQIGTYLYISEALTADADAPLQLSVFYSQAASKTRNIYLFLTKGLSDGSPDFSLGGSMQFYF